MVIVGFRPATRDDAAAVVVRVERVVTAPAPPPPPPLPAARVRCGALGPSERVGLSATFPRFRVVVFAAGSSFSAFIPPLRLSLAPTLDA